MCLNQVKMILLLLDEQIIAKVSRLQYVYSGVFGSTLARQFDLV